MPIFRRRTGLMGPRGWDPRGCSKYVVHCGYTATSQKKPLENAPYNYATFERVHNIVMLCYVISFYVKHVFSAQKTFSIKITAV